MPRISSRYPKAELTIKKYKTKFFKKILYQHKYCGKLYKRY